MRAPVRESKEGVNRMVGDAWTIHIGYLEKEVKKIDGRAAKVEALIPYLQDEQKRHALLDLVNHLRDEANYHRKYLALVKR
jgi:hypothetical protein